MEKSLYANLRKVKHFEISKASSIRLERKSTEYNIKKPSGKIFSRSWNGQLCSEMLNKMRNKN